MAAPLRRPWLFLGALAFCAAAWLDASFTLSGIGADLTLEGNPFLRASMIRMGPVQALFVDKALTGLVCLSLAYLLEPEIRRKAAWIDKVPSTPWARAWYKRGDRSWLAYLPLYGVAVFQLLGAVSWAVLSRRQSW